jgi:hypothetical protein
MTPPRIEHPPSPLAWGLDLPAILTARRGALRQLLELSRRQLQLIEADDYTQLLAVQGATQRLLSGLNAWNDTTPTLKERWRTGRDGLPATVRAACDQLLEESESLLTELFEEERVSTERLQQRRDETRRELESLTLGTQVHNAYRQTATPRDHVNLDLNT